MKIAGDYQYKALTEGFFVQRNWHDNKLDLVELMDLCDETKLLVDIGCGSGNFLFRYQTKFKELLGFDNSKEALLFIEKRIKKEKTPNEKNIKGDLNQTTLVLPHDFAVCMEVIEHFDLTSLRTKIFPNIKSFVKPNGILFITTPNRVSLWPLIEACLDVAKLTPNMAKDQHFSSFTEHALCTLLENSGFEVKRVGSFNHLSPFLPLDFLRKLMLNIELKYMRKYGPLLYVVATRLPEKV